VTIDSAGFSWTNYQAVLFDLDGVITPTAEVHEKAWSELFAPWDCIEADYLQYIDGKPRYDGVRSFLASRGVSLPEGTPDSPPEEESVCGYGNRKNDLFVKILNRDGVKPYPGSVAILEYLEAQQIPSAIVSSSRNAQMVLEAAGLGDRFKVVVDGDVVAERNLRGKPEPDAFNLGAELLNAPADTTIVVEDAISGVAAGAAGHFGLVVGVNRGIGVQPLQDAGADLVVNDLQELLPKK
jgi:beta-phosphoglucomutase family hydrolase